MSAHRSRLLKILVTGGGTAGHVVPVLAVVEKLRAKFHAQKLPFELLFVGRSNSPEQAIIERAGIPYAAISAGKLRRYVDAQNLLDPLRVMVGFFQAIGLILRFRPDVVFAKGGYVSIPIVGAARLLGRPVVAHETDAVIGLSNRFAVQAGSVLCTGYPIESYARSFKSARAVYTGNPVLSEFFKVSQSVRTKPPYTLLVVGGSQGARAINRALSALIQRPLEGLAIIHLTGRDHYSEHVGQASTWYHPIAYTDHMADLVAQADVVVSRSGGSIFELAAAGRPTILIPLSSSANLHQPTNAAFFQKHRAAVVIDEADLTPDSLRDAVNQLLSRATERRELSRAIHQLAIPDAAARVAHEILRAAGKDA